LKFHPGSDILTKKKNKEKETWKPEIFPVDSKEIKEACGILSDLIKLDTTNPPGNELIAANYCKELLEKEGFSDVEVIESESGRGSVVCRWKGSDPEAKKLLLLAHLDVVPAHAENWERDPFCGDIEGEYVWGRGSLDCKGLVTTEAMACIILKREGFQPKGDVILAFTADEEDGGVMGVGYLTKNHWDDVNAEYIINEGGGFLLPLGKNPKDYIVQTGEKGVFRTTIRVRGKGGHGSMPIKRKDSAMYKISKITQKIIEYKYPIEITQPVREMAAKMPIPGIAKRLMTSKRMIRPLIKLLEKFMGDSLSSLLLPFYIDIINPTGLKGSAKVNNIPQYTEMTYDCRLLPGHDRETVKEYFKNALGKLYKEIEMIPIEPTQPATINSVENPFWELVEGIMNEMHEGARLIPMLSAGSTDAKFFRERGSYVLGFVPMRLDPNVQYSEMLEMAHGRNERMWIPNISYGIEFIYRLIKSL